MTAVTAKSAHTGARGALNLAVEPDQRPDQTGNRRAQQYNEFTKPLHQRPDDRGRLACPCELLTEVADRIGKPR